MNFEFTTRKMLPIFDFKRLHCVELVHSNTTKMSKNNQTNSGDQTDEKEDGRRMERTEKKRRDTNDGNAVDVDIDQTKCNDQRDEKGR